MIAALSSWIGLCSFIAVAFLKADTRLRPQYRIILSSWLRGERDATKNWATVIATLFDWIFKTSGPKRLFGLQLYLPNFPRALLSSIITALALGSLWYALLPESSELFLAGYDKFSVLGIEINLPSVLGYQSRHFIDGEELLFMGKQPLAPLVIYPLFSNILLDYISLIETRYIITLMETNISKYPRYIFVDTAICVLLVYIVGYASIELASIIFNLNFHYLIKDLIMSPLIYFRLLSPEYAELHTYARQLSGIYGIFIYSTFLTSVWLWMFLFGFLLIRIVRIVPIFLKVVNKIFDLDTYIANKPLALMGWILIFVVTMFFLALQANFLIG